MAEKNSFVLYHQYNDILRDLSNEQFGILMRALFGHSMGQEPGMLPPEIAMAYRFIANQIDIDREKYDKKCEGRKVSGAVGGKKRAENVKQNQANQANATFATNSKQIKQTQANQADNDYDNVNENENVYVYDYDNVNEQNAQSAEKSVSQSRENENLVSSCGKPVETVETVENFGIDNTENMPALSEVESYCQKNHPNVIAADFYDYYKAQNWCCNGKPIKSWQSLLAIWAKHQKPQEQPPSYDIDTFIRLSMQRSFDEV